MVLTSRMLSTHASYCHSFVRSCRGVCASICAVPTQRTLIAVCGSRVLTWRMGMQATCRSAWTSSTSTPPPPQ
eukprot:2119786-Rhodomonas_salina.1